MATEQEKAQIRALKNSGVSRFTINPDGTTSGEARSLDELNRIQADHAAEDLVAAGKRPVTTIHIATSKGICW